MKTYMTQEGRAVFLHGTGVAHYGLMAGEELHFMLAEPGEGKPLRGRVIEDVGPGSHWALYGHAPEPAGLLLACDARQFQAGGTFREVFSLDVTTMPLHHAAPDGRTATLTTVPVRVEVTDPPALGEVWRTKHGHSLIVTEPPEFNQHMVGGVYLTEPYAGRYARVTVQTLTGREAVSATQWREQPGEVGRERAGD